jgi:hypothetical protein
LRQDVDDDDADDKHNRVLLLYLLLEDSKPRRVCKYGLYGSPTLM